MQGLTLLQDAVGRERRPLGLSVGDDGVVKAASEARRDQLREQRSRARDLRTPDQV